MTKEEAKKRLEVWLICGECPEDKQCYDSHLHSTCEYTDYCDEVSLTDAVKVAVSALSENKTQMIDKSNFDAEQYKTDLQSAYDCGYNKALSENSGEWIPVSERLPEEEHEVYCQLSDGSNAVLYVQDNWGQMEWVDGMMGTGTYDVVAWREKPKPYKAEKGGE